MIVWIILDLVMACVTAAIAERKGFNAGAWFAYAFLVWPVALIHVAVKEPTPQLQERAAIERGEMKQCPQCAEPVRRAAKKCRFCGYDFNAPTGTGAPPAARRAMANRLRRSMGG